MSIHHTAKVHPTAVVAAGAHVGEGVIIGPFCVVEEHVTIGANTHLHSHVVLAGHTTLGANNRIFPFASLGQAPQDLKHDGEPTKLIIGDNNEIREYTTMHTGTVDDIGETRVGSNNLFMASTHVAHDCVVGNNCILANSAALAGHVTLEDNVRIGGLSAIAQFVRIGHAAFVGGHCALDRDIPPFGKVSSPTDALGGANVVGLRRSGLANDDIRALSATFALLYAEDREKPMKELAEELLAAPDLTAYQRQVLQFVMQGARKRQGQA